MKCPLCQNISSKKITVHDAKRGYWHCPICQLIFVDPQYLLSRQEEEARYLLHNNDINDRGYQAFVSDITNFVIQTIPTSSCGLDYGAGPGPVISSLLTEQGYKMELYDPFFANFPEKLSCHFDFIVCCEVVEHFHRPNIEFEQLKSCLKKGAYLIIKTALYQQLDCFANWYYHRDPTHVSFFHRQTFCWIKEQYCFNKCSFLNQRVVILEK